MAEKQQGCDYLGTTQVSTAPNGAALGTNNSTCGDTPVCDGCGKCKFHHHRVGLSPWNIHTFGTSSD
ncbi:hypothetical protein [Shimazuella alba]|uniref:Uncharacterized protein n=1 Tax=Shimazuella alba TaxID=2690964 RepID=A0A6I4VSN6_9BACL|nr:hypothetical protein [Shimazuella alba]MXQ54749.1 hypothetical protein [Shimazuella alba]